MNLRRIFKAAVEKGIIRICVEPGPFPSDPGVSAWDASVMMDEAARRQWEDVEYYGPGRDAAEARRAAAIARMNARIPAKETPPPPTPKKARRSTKRERLEAEAAALKSEIEKLKIGGKK